MDHFNGLKRFDASSVADGANGEPAYIIVKTRIKGKYARIFTAVGQSAARMMAINPDEMTEADIETAYKLAQEVNSDIDQLFEAYAAMIVEWNWLDSETAEPLPQPDIETIRDELDQYQIAFIRSIITSILRYPATEGNSRTGSG